MDQPVLVRAVGKLAQAGEQAGLSVEDMIRILNADVSLETLLDLIERGGTKSHGELDHAVSASSCAPFIHRIAIQMSAQGRFLICLDCQLHFEFLSGTPYLAVAHEFVSQPCVGHARDDKHSN